MAFKLTFILVNKGTETPSAAAPQLLSKLFPQTAVTDEENLKKEEEKQKQQEEGCKFAGCLSNSKTFIFQTRKKSKTSNGKE